MQQSTIETLTAKLPEIRSMLEAGIGRETICQTIGYSHPTLRAFLKLHGIRFDRVTRQTSGIMPGDWDQFTPTAEVSPFTHAQLKLRSLEEHAPDELAAILARLRMRMAEAPRRRRRVRTAPWYQDTPTEPGE